MLIIAQFQLFFNKHAKNVVEGDALEMLPIECLMCFS